MPSKIGAIASRYKHDRRPKTYLQIHPQRIRVIREKWSGRYGSAVARARHGFEFKRKLNSLTAIDPFDTGFLVRATWCHGEYESNRRPR